MLISWDNKFSVQVKEMDNHHIQLISIINELHEAMLLGKGKEVMSNILAKLVDYTKFHFSAEEDYLLKHGYPKLNSQIESHKMFVEKVEGFLKEYSSGKLTLSMEVMNFLKDWLTNHINKSDKQYGEFFKSKSII